MTTPAPRDDRSGIRIIDEDEPLCIALLRLLAQGRPVPLGELAGVTGRTAEQVRAALDAQPDIEYDDAGNIIGNGITLRPTPHHFEINGHRLYTWCALDTLVFPALLDRPAHVTSACHTTGAPIHVDVAPDRIISVHPAGAVISLVNCADTAAVRAAFCDQIHFFAGDEAARSWLADHPAAWLSPVAQAQEVGRNLISALPLAGGKTGNC